MGASLWHEEVPWHPDPVIALRSYQVEYFKANHDLQGELTCLFEDAREAVRLTKKEGDRYGLLAIYTKQLADLKAVISKPLPRDVGQSLLLLRRLLPEGFGNILDVTDVNATGGVNVTRVVAPADIATLVGSAKPPRDQAMALMERIHQVIGRGESVCFPIYIIADVPAYWFFVGYSCD